MEYFFYELPEGGTAGCECCGDENIPTGLFGQDFLALREGAPPKKLICELCANSYGGRNETVQSMALMLNIVRRELGAFKDVKLVSHPGKEVAA
jgi:hypothetical protein